MVGLSIPEKDLSVFANSSTAFSYRSGAAEGYASDWIVAGGRLYEISKRALDLACAFIGLVLSAPLALLIALLIKLDSPGPIIFKQTRVGMKRRSRKTADAFRSQHKTRSANGIFTIYKFRTMYMNTDHEGKKSKGNDSRVTRIGTWLRRTSLDELPQLWNVLCGEMSMVGPRPEIVSVVEKYSAIEHQRLRIKPGLTGLWQLYGDHTRPIHENLHFDLAYLHTRSFYADLKILWKTVGFVLRLANA